VIVFLLIVIIVILLLGAAAVKAAVFRNLALMAALVPLVILFQIARTVPVWVWPVLVASVVVGILGLDQWQKAGWRREEAEQKREEIERLRGYGLSEDEIALHQAFGEAGDYRAQTEVFSNAAGRVAREKLEQTGSFDDDRARAKGLLTID